MITKEILPVGSVVLLKNSTKKLMIMGVLQAKPDHLDQVYDYCGCLYPEGYMSADRIYLFNEDQIETLYYPGYHNEEQDAFEARLREIQPVTGHLTVSG